MADARDGRPLRALLDEAWGRRAPLHDDAATDTYRVFHGHSEGRPGLVVERFGPVFRARCGRGPGWDLDDGELAALHGFVSEVGGPDAALVLARGRDRPRLELGALPAQGACLAREHGLVFGVEPLAPGNVGLFLDARPARTWVRAHAAGRRVLNLFAWTGGFGVAAKAGGAQSVLHVDEQKRALARARENHTRNEQAMDGRDFLREDVYRVLRQATKRRQRFGGIVIDAPPAVPSRPAAGQDLERLVPLALEVLEEDGWILATLNRRDRTQQAEEQAILHACDARLAVVARGTSGVDFPESDPEQKLRFSGFA